MKTKLLLIAVLTWPTVLALLAATLTIDVPAADVPRVQEAFGSILNLGRPANLVEVQNATKQWLIGSTQDYERRKNTYTYTPPPMEMQPSPTPTPAGLTAPVAAAAVAAPTPKSTPTPTPKPKGWWN